MLGIWTPLSRRFAAPLRRATPVPSAGESGEPTTLCDFCKVCTTAGDLAQPLSIRGDSPRTCANVAQTIGGARKLRARTHWNGTFVEPVSERRIPRAPFLKEPLQVTAAIAADARRTLEERRAAIERTLPEAPTETAWRELAETQAALERIEEGSYGRCESCGGAIGRQRLLALPTTRFCIACSPGTPAVRR